MRPDFNKQLTERERLGHTMHFGEFRNCKGNKVIDEEMSGGKESIHTRRRLAAGPLRGRKQFNENLNPLKNFLRVNVGRPWDKIYSEITTAFDKRKVINNHILEHLFQYVELQVHIIDGKPCTMNTRRYGPEELYSPITTNPRYPTYYVDPRDGILKAPKAGKTRRQRDAESAAEESAAAKKVFCKIDKDSNLHLVNDVWYVYTMKDRPQHIIEYTAPPGWNQGIRWDDPKYVRWDGLTPEEQKELGVPTPKEVRIRDLGIPAVPGYRTGSKWNGYSYGKEIVPENRYYAHRQTASKAQLKAAGLEGAYKEPEKRLSHREASKYRKKDKK